MTETPKDKRAKALERIKEIALRRGAASAPGAAGHATPDGKRPKAAPKHGAAGHRTADR